MPKRICNNNELPFDSSCKLSIDMTHTKYKRYKIILLKFFNEILILQSENNHQNAKLNSSPKFLLIRYVVYFHIES